MPNPPRVPASPHPVAAAPESARHAFPVEPDFFDALVRLARPRRLFLLDPGSGLPLLGAPLPARLACDLAGPLAGLRRESYPSGVFPLTAAALCEAIEGEGRVRGLLVLSGGRAAAGEGARLTLAALSSALRLHLAVRLAARERSRELSTTRDRLEFLLDSFRLSRMTGTDLDGLLAEVLDNLCRLRGIGGGMIVIESVDLSGRRRTHRVERLAGDLPEGTADALRERTLALPSAILLDDPFTIRRITGLALPFDALLLAPVGCGHDRPETPCPMRTLRPGVACADRPCWRGGLALHGRPGTLFTREDRDFVKHVVERLVLQFFSAFLLLEHERGEKLNREMALARQIQKNLLPSRPPEVTGVELRTYNQSAELVGGDFYDHHAPRKDLLLVALGDISGKSVSAALLHSMIQRVLHSWMARPWGVTAPRAGEILAHTNEELFDSLLAVDMFATLAVARIDARRGFLEFASAGHLPPLLLRGGRAVPFQEAPGIRRVVDLSGAAGEPPSAEERRGSLSGTPIGFMKEAAYETWGFPLLPGDAALFYSDGLVEVFGEPIPGAGRDLFGAERLARAFESAAADPARPIERALSALMRSIRDFSADADLRDDQTALIFRYTGPADYTGESRAFDPGI